MSLFSEQTEKAENRLQQEALSPQPLINSPRLEFSLKPFESEPGYF